MGGEELVDLGASDDVFEFVRAGTEAERTLAVVATAVGGGPVMVPETYGGGKVPGSRARDSVLQVVEPVPHVGTECDRCQAYVMVAVTNEGCAVRYL